MCLILGMKWMKYWYVKAYAGVKTTVLALPQISQIKKLMGSSGWLMFYSALSYSVPSDLLYMCCKKSVLQLSYLRKCQGRSDGSTIANTILWTEENHSRIIATPTFQKNRTGEAVSLATK